MITRKTRQFVLWTAVLSTVLLSTEARCAIPSSWIDPGRIMVVYNTTRMDSVAPAEPDTFSRDIAQWYMKRYGMPTTHLFGYDMGTKVRWNNPGAFDFLQAVADYIKRHDIQIVLLAPGTPMIVRDLNERRLGALAQQSRRTARVGRVGFREQRQNLRRFTAQTRGHYHRREYPAPAERTATRLVQRVSATDLRCHRGRSDGEQRRFGTRRLRDRQHLGRPALRPVRGQFRQE